MKNINLIAIVRSLKKVLGVLRKYQVTIVIVIVFGTLIAVVARVNSILSQPPDEAYRSQAQQKSLHTNFDEATIKSIQDLRAQRENTSFKLPPGRNNPFAE